MSQDVEDSTRVNFAPITRRVYTRHEWRAGEMNPILGAEFDAKRDAIAALCKKYGVANLDLFGSGTTEEWRPLDSDLDFVVAFRPDPNGRLADRYLGLAEDLESLFGRPVDLITPASIRNPYFRQRVDATRSRIYSE